MILALTHMAPLPRAPLLPNGGVPPGLSALTSRVHGAGSFFGRTGVAATSPANDLPGREGPGGLRVRMARSESGSQWSRRTRETCAGTLSQTLGG